MVRTVQIADTSWNRQEAEGPCCAIRHLHFQNEPLSINGTGTIPASVRTPSSGVVRANRFRNLPLALGFTCLPRHGDNGGKSLSTEVRNAPALWTHTCLRSSRLPFCRTASEQRVLATSLVDRRHNLTETCVRGARTDWSGFTPAAHHSATVSLATVAACFCPTKRTDQLYARIHSALLHSYIHRERHLR